jgi:hypothetical protein
MQTNEGKACDAILRHLEGRDGASRSNIRWPEQEGHSAPVDLVCSVGSRLYAVEHTSIEPFGGFLQLNNQAAHLFQPIEEAIAAIVPPDEVYELVIPVLAMQGKTGREVRQIQEALIAWIKQTASTLTKQRYADYVNPPAPVNLSNVPFPVELFRFEGIPGLGRLQIRHSVTGDREAMREQRIRQACDDKFGKLASWKHDAGARTVLLLENPDIQITNSSRVAETFLSLAEPRSDRPDETYLIDTFTSGPWFLWPLLIGDKTYFDLGRETHPLALEIDPAALVSVTKR